MTCLSISYIIKYLLSLAEELRSILQELFAAGSIDIREGGVRSTPAAPLSREVRGTAEKPLLHFWAENCNGTRRVVTISDQAEERLLLAVERCGWSCGSEGAADLPCRPRQKRLAFDGIHGRIQWNL